MHALTYIGGAAAGACAVFTLAIVAMRIAAKDSIYDGYPQAIRDGHGPQSRRGRIVDLVGGILLWACLIALILGALAGWRAENGGNLGPWRAAALTAAVLIAIVVSDTVVIDWLLLCKLQLRIFEVPGAPMTMPEYRDYGYHVKVLYPSMPWIVGLGASVGGLGWWTIESLVA